MRRDNLEVLACQGNSFRGRDKSTRALRSFPASAHTTKTTTIISTTTTTPRRQSRRLGKRGWRVAVWTSFGGLEGHRGCGVSGISSWDRERHFVPPLSPLFESEVPSWGSGSHKWPSPRPTYTGRHEHEVNPTRHSHHPFALPPRFFPLTVHHLAVGVLFPSPLWILQLRNITSTQMER